MITAIEINKLCEVRLHEEKLLLNELFPELLTSEILLTLTETVNTVVFHVLKPFFSNIKIKYPAIKISENDVRNVAKKALNSINWKNIWNELKQKIKQHGWKIAVTLVFWELFKLYILPAICSLSGFPEVAVAFKLLPIGELTIVPLFEKLYDALLAMVV